MITAGCDIGSLTAKAVILRDGQIAAEAVMRSLPRPEDSAREVMAAALAKAGIAREEVRFCVGTGYGRGHIPFVDAVESEITCHARGASWRDPSIRTLIDIGGQDAKAIRIDGAGNVERYVYNDKCASGTGRFLEIIAGTLEVPLEELGALAERSGEHLTLSNQCVVFAESEIVSLVHEGRAVPDIVNALHRAVAGRAASLARGIEPVPAAAFSGGVAHNSGMRAALEEALGMPLSVVPGPQVNGALGAALIAAERAGS